MLRLVAALAVVLLGALAVLVVLDIIPRDLLQAWGVKVLLVTGIVAVMAFDRDLAIAQRASSLNGGP